MLNRRTVTALAALTLGGVTAAPAKAAGIGLSALVLNDVTFTIGGGALDTSGGALARLTARARLDGVGPFQTRIGAPFASFDVPISTVGAGPFPAENAFLRAPFGGSLADGLASWPLVALQADTQPPAGATGEAFAEYVSQFAYVGVPAGASFTLSGTALFNMAVDADAGDTGSATAGYRLQTINERGIQIFYTAASACPQSRDLESLGAGFAEHFCFAPFSFTGVLEAGRTVFIFEGVAESLAKSAEEPPPPPVPVPATLALFGVGLAALGLRRCH